MTAPPPGEPPLDSRALGDLTLLERQQDRLAEHNAHLTTELARLRAGLASVEQELRGEADTLEATLFDGHKNVEAPIVVMMKRYLADKIAALRAEPKMPAFVDDESRCAVCGWTLATTVERGCVRGNCSLRPRPDRLYAPERAKREWAALRAEPTP